jgi:LPXTG-motif cell wall-anchored protein
LTNTVRIVQVAKEYGGDESVTGRPRAPRLLRLLAASSLVVGVGVVGVAVGRAGAGSTAAISTTAYVLSDVHCSPRGDGVLDITLVNDDPVGGAQFEVGPRDAASSVAVHVGPSAAHALTFTALPDGDVAMPVWVDGVEQVVRVNVNCDLPRVQTLDGVARQGSAQVGTTELPRTGSDLGGLIIGGVLVSAGIAASLLARRRYS